MLIAKKSHLTRCRIAKSHKALSNLLMGEVHMGTTPLEKYQELAAKLRASGPESISGKTVIQVGNATCENAAGSRQKSALYWILTV